MRGLCWNLAALSEGMWGVLLSLAALAAFLFFLWELNRLGR